LYTSSAQENFRLANPEVLRSGGSSGVAGISTFMSRTHAIAVEKLLRGSERCVVQFFGTLHQTVAAAELRVE
jgi:hypothetical protein